MRKNYIDFVEAMAAAVDKGYTVDRLVLTSDSMETFLTDEKLTDKTEEMHDDLGEFSVSIETGEENVIVTENGTRFAL